MSAHLGVLNIWRRTRAMELNNCEESEFGSEICKNLISENSQKDLMSEIQNVSSQWPKSSMLFFCSCFLWVLCHCETSNLPNKKQTKPKEHFVKDCCPSRYQSIFVWATGLVPCCTFSQRLPDFQWKHKKMKRKTN